MPELAIIVALIAIAVIGVFAAFGNVIQGQTGAMAAALLRIGPPKPPHATPTITRWTTSSKLLARAAQPSLGICPVAR